MEKTVNTPIIEYLLRLADDRLILGHRLSEWCGHAPILEEDIALANIALDCIGQANYLYGAAAQEEGKGRTADAIVYFREALEYKNLLLVEQPNGDFARTIVRQFLYDSFGVLLFDRLQHSTFHPLSGIAEKAVKELRYHFRHSSQWMLRLGDGTAESHMRSQKALDELWKFTDEMFLADPLEDELVKKGVGIASHSLMEEWTGTVHGIVAAATLTIPQKSAFIHTGGRSGRHTEHLGHLLSEMQIVARSFPDIQW
ncbi:MAG: 1,2-phenylacetyl-CoA epoxidase subunit PaaC [Bacteroidota bacterium]